MGNKLPHIIYIKVTLSCVTTLFNMVWFLTLNIIPLNDRSVCVDLDVTTVQGIGAWCHAVLPCPASHQTLIDKAT